MKESRGKPKDNSNEFKPVADTICTWLREIMNGGSYPSIEIDNLPGTFREVGIEFQRLNTYVEQKRQKNQDEKDELSDIFFNDTVRIRVDVARTHHLMRAVNEAAVLLLEAAPEDGMNSILRGMEMIGECTVLDGVHLWQNTRRSDGKNHFQNVCRWRRNTLPNAPRSEFMFHQTPNWSRQLPAGVVINGPVRNFEDNERLLIENMGILSLVLIPIFIKGEFWGAVGFDDCNEERVFSNEEIDIFRFWGLLVIGTLQRHSTAFNLQTVARHYKGLIWSVDCKGIVTTFQGQYAQRLLPDPKKSDTTHLEIAQFENSPLSIISNVQKTFQEGPQHWTSEIDNVIFHSYTTPMYDETGKIIGVVGSTDDVTDMNHLQRALERSNNAMANFLANMSHELRTPLNAILGMSELVLRETIPPAVREYTHTIKRAGKNLLVIVNDVLDFSKFESGNLEIICEEYSFSSMLHNIINLIKMWVYDYHLRFVINVDNNLPDILMGDVDRIHQVCINLLSNAIKYTKQGFVSLSVEGDMVDDNTIMLRIRIEDSGIGIKQEDIGKLFEKFIRLDQTKNKHIVGTGLGLTITQSLVVAMDGKIEVQSTYGKGSVFTVFLPQTIVGHTKLVTVNEPEKKFVLLFERREQLKESISYAMNGLGINYEFVSTPSEFYEHIQSKKYSHAFIASTLYDNVKEEYPGLKTETIIILVVELGETVTNPGIRILSTPIYSIPIANFLNGVDDGVDEKVAESMVQFVAPTARVLSVDDIETNLVVFDGLLKMYEIQVDSCDSGMKAVEAVKNVFYDIVFVDHMMPEMDGIETVEHIRSLGNEYPHLQAVPIVALTANAIVGVKEMLLDHGFNDFLSKPIDMNNLNTILDKWIPAEKRKAMEKPLEKPNQDTDVGFEIEGLNIKQGITLSGGTVENYMRTLAIFLKDGRAKLGNIRMCLETNNLPLYTIYIHAMVSASANVGAQSLSDTAKTLENAGKQEDRVFIQTHNERFLTDLETLLERINAVLPRAEDAKPKSYVCWESVKTELTLLKTALNAYDSATIKRLTVDLQAMPQSSEVAPVIADILHNVLIGDYDKTITLIDSVL